MVLQVKDHRPQTTDYKQQEKAFVGTHPMRPLSTPKKEKVKIPCAVFTDPEIASVGLTEDEAKKNFDINIGHMPMSFLGRAKV